MNTVLGSTGLSCRLYKSAHSKASMSTCINNERGLWCMSKVVCETLRLYKCAVCVSNILLIKGSSAHYNAQ